MKYYFLQNDAGVITDVITFAHPGYTPVEVSGDLPRNIHAGYYRIQSGGLVEDADLRTQFEDQIKKENANYENTMAELIAVKEAQVGTEQLNAELLFDSMTKESRIETLEQQQADLTFELIMGGVL